MAAIEPGTTPDAPAAEGATTEVIPDFANVREAQAYAREHNSVPNLSDIPDEPVVVAPVVDPAADEFGDVFPVTDPATPAAPAAPTAPVTDPFAAYGGQTAVEDAVVVANALKTEQGVRAIAAQTLTALGYTPEAVQAFLATKGNAEAVVAAAPPVADDPFADIADDDVVDGATVKQMLAKLGQTISQQVIAAQQAATQPLQDQIQEDRARVAKNTVDSALAESLSLPTDGTALSDVQRSQVADVQAFAARYIQEGNWDPSHIRNAVLRGAADMKARDEARFQAYVADKRAAKAAAPANIGGGSPAGGEPIREPQSAKEAAQMRKALGL